MSTTKETSFWSGVQKCFIAGREMIIKLVELRPFEVSCLCDMFINTLKSPTVWFEIEKETILNSIYHITNT